MGEVLVVTKEKNVEELLQVLKKTITVKSRILNTLNMYYLRILEII